MKKTITLFACFLLVSLNIQAQTKTWNFSDWEISGGYSENTLIDNLALIPGEGTTNLGAIDKSTPKFSDGFSPTLRLKHNGASYDSSATTFTMPTKRYFYFAVKGSSTIRIWYKNGNSSGTRTLYVTDGTNIIGSNTVTDDSGQIFTANYTGNAGNIYIAAGGGAINIYKIEATNIGVTELPEDIATESVQPKLNAKIVSSGTQVRIANLNSKSTEIKVYDTTGSLIKSLKTAFDTQFELHTKGMYIVHLKSEQGIQSSKLMIQ